MVYVVSATVDEDGKVSSVRYNGKAALKLALELSRDGYTNIRVTVGGESYTLEEFRMLIG
jgi:hypothetical protein